MTGRDDPKPLAQPGAMMFERNISIIASRGRQVRVVTVYEEDQFGFVSGLDEEWLELCTSSDATQMLINRRHIILCYGMREGLDDVRDPEIRKSIDDRVRTFRSVSKGFQNK